MSTSFGKNIGFKKTRHDERLGFAYLVGHGKDIIFVHLHSQGMHIEMIEQLIWFSLVVKGQNRQPNV